MTLIMTLKTKISRLPTYVTWLILTRLKSRKLEILLGSKIGCECTECNCQEKFEMIETEELLNLIQHGRLNQEQIIFLKTRVGSRICKLCFIGKHKK